MAPSCCNSKSCVNVTSPSDPIAIASVSDAEPMLPASGMSLACDLCSCLLRKAAMKFPRDQVLLADIDTFNKAI